MQYTIQQELKGVCLFVGVIWLVFVLGCILPFNLAAHGLIPRSAQGLPGIVTMPFLHANFEHIAHNTPPLFVLLVLLAGSQASSRNVVVAIVLLGGALLWLVGRPANHIGASGLIFGLMGFLIVSGLLERRFVPLGIALVVIFLYGGSLLAGVVPRLGSHISWDGHFCGAAAGGVIAYALTRNSRQKGLPPDTPLPLQV